MATRRVTKTQASASNKSESVRETTENIAVQPPQSPQWRAAAHTRSAADAQLSVEEYLRQECERTVEQVMAHAEARVRQFEFEAARIRREMQPFSK
jgi:hypothetical protein